MILRILFYFVLLYGAFELVKFLFLKAKTINQCEYCDGLGYWLGTRGEKNHCKRCDGGGKNI